MNAERTAVPTPVLPVLELRQVQRMHRGGKLALDGIDLTVQPGESVALIGRNGAGKTTLLRCLLGLIRPQRGRLAVFGLDPIAEPVAVKRRIGYVAEDLLLPKSMRAEDALALHRDVYPDWDEAFARRLVTRFGILTDVHVGALSKGEARQLELVCALAHRPDLLLLDEPAGGLDPVVRRTMIATAVEVLAESGATMLFSSHLMQDVERLARRVVVLDRGRVQLDEPIDVLLEDYALLTVAAADEAMTAGALRRRRVGDRVHALFREPAERLHERLRPSLPSSAQVRPLPLEDLFVELAGDGEPAMRPASRRNGVR